MFEYWFSETILILRLFDTVLCVDTTKYKFFLLLFSLWHILEFVNSITNPRLIHKSRYKKICRGVWETQLGIMMHTFNISIREIEAGGFPGFRPALSTMRNPVGRLG